MADDFDDSFDSPSFDDVGDSSDIGGSDAGDLNLDDAMFDVPSDDSASLDDLSVPEGFGDELPAENVETLDVGGLMDDDSDLTDDFSSDLPETAELPPPEILEETEIPEADLSSDADDLITDQDMEDLGGLDLGAEEMDDTAEDNIEDLMNDVETVPEMNDEIVDVEPEAVGELPEEESVESLLDTEDDVPDVIPETPEEVETLFPEEMPELVGEGDEIAEAVPDEIPEALEEEEPGFPNDVPGDIGDTPEISEVVPDVAEDETEFPEVVPDVIEEGGEIPEDVPDVIEEGGEIPEDVPDVVDVAPDTPPDSETSAYDRLYDYYTSHNYGQQDYGEYSKDPEWQQLNNAYLQELGREPIDYGANDSDAQYISDMQDELVAAGIPEDSPELEAILANEQAGLDEINNPPDTDEGLDEIAEDEPDLQVFEIDNETDIPDETPEDIAETDEVIPEAVEETDIPEEAPAETEEVPEENAEEEAIEETDVQEKPPREYDDFEKEVLEYDPEFYESGSFYEQGVNEYGFQGTCGPTSQANALNNLLGTNEFTENKVLDVAVENNLCNLDDSPENCGGTTTEQFMELYDRMNEQIGDKINTELYEFDDALDVEDVAAKLDEGCVLNVAVDASALWDQPRDYVNSNGIYCDDFYSDHWITVTGVQRDETGNILGFDIIDSGGGVDYVDADKYHEICFGTDDHKVLDPTAIVVSKKTVAEPAEIPEIPEAQPEEKTQGNWFQRLFGRRK